VFSVELVNKNKLFKLVIGHWSLVIGKTFIPSFFLSFFLNS
jgi:hypothetical protein